jgi:hypothetical protein
MAELTPTTVAACCSSETQTTCCEPQDKEGCCTPQSTSCGCAAGDSTTTTTDVRDVVRERYAAAARVAAGSSETACGCGVGVTDDHGNEVFGAALYDETSREELPDAAVSASLGLRRTDRRRQPE